jgi:hypothetical protein
MGLQGSGKKIGSVRNTQASDKKVAPNRPPIDPNLQNNEEKSRLQTTGYLAETVWGGDTGE